MIISSYCPHCRAVRDFTIRRNVGPALVPVRYGYRETLYTASEAPGYVVRGRCPVNHRDASGRWEGKDIVIPREQKQRL